MFLYLVVPCMIVQALCADPPNILMITSDDMGHRDVSYHGSDQIPTPNIDSIAYNGHILAAHASLPTCTPSRAALLTGVHPIRMGFQGVPISAGEPRALPHSVPLLPEVLRKHGYATHMVGKWHLGADYRNVTPTGRGFDSHYGYWNGYIGFFLHNCLGPPVAIGLDMHDNLDTDYSTIGKYATDLFTGRALRVVEEHNASRPLFLMVNHLAGHAGSALGGAEPPDLLDSLRKFRTIKDPFRRMFAGAVSRMDESIGLLMQAFAKRDMLENTVVVYLNDNGAQTWGVQFANSGSNWPLRGLKFTMFQGGIRTAGAVWSSLFKRKNAINTNLFHISDWTPTLLEAAGADMSKMKFDGKSHWKYLTTEDPPLLDDKPVLINIDEKLQMAGIYTADGRFKYLEGTFYYGIYDGYYGDQGREYNPNYISSVLRSPANRAIQKTNSQPPLTANEIISLRSQMEMQQLNGTREHMTCLPHCLFDLFLDPTETKNVSSAYPDVVISLQNALAVYKRELVPQLNKPTDPRANPIFHRGAWVPWLESV